MHACIGRNKEMDMYTFKREVIAPKVRAFKQGKDATQGGLSLITRLNTKMLVGFFRNEEILIHPETLDLINLGI